MKCMKLNNIFNSQLFSSNIAVIIYFFLIGLVGLYSKRFTKDLLAKHDSFSLMVLEGIIGICVLLPFILSMKNKTIHASVNKFMHMKYTEWCMLIGLGFFGIITGYIGTLILKKHEPSKLLIIDIVIGLALGLIGDYFYEKKPVRLRQIAGLIIAGSGAYLLM